MNKRKRLDDKLYKITRPKAIERDSIDGYPCCVICGAPATEVHHIFPRGRGGTSELTNLACLCRYCHDKEHIPIHPVGQEVAIMLSFFDCSIFIVLSFVRFYFVHGNSLLYPFSYIGTPVN